MFVVGGLFMKSNAYVSEGRNEGVRVATPTNFSIFDFYDMKSLWFKFGYDIFGGFKDFNKNFHYIKRLKNGHPNFKDLLFWSQWRYHNQI